MKTANQIVSIADFKNKAATPSLLPLVDRSNVEQEQRRLDDLVDDMSAWLIGRWDGQISRKSPVERQLAHDAWRESLMDMTSAEIERARQETIRWPYPPNAAAFLRSGQCNDAEEQFRLALRAAAMDPPAWHTLPSRTYATVMTVVELGHNIRVEFWERGGEPTAFANAWRTAYRAACRKDDLGELAAPPASKPALPHKRDRDAGMRGCVGMHDVLAGRIPTPPEPQHSAEYRARIAKLGIAPR